MGANFGIPANSTDIGNGSGGGLPHVELLVNYMPSIEGIPVVGQSKEEGVLKKNKKKINGPTLKVKVENPSLRRLIGGAVAGAISRTAVAPLETIRTHLMVGRSGHSTTWVFDNIMKTDGWKGLFKGNLVNVIGVASQYGKDSPSEERFDNTM